MALVKFYRGSKTSYAGAGKHRDAIYFATDTKEIMMNEVAFGFGSEALADMEEKIAEKIKTVEFSGNNTITFKDGKGNVVKTVVLAEAAIDLAGLMSAADKVKVDGITETTEQTNAKITAVQTEVDANKKAIQDEVARAKAAEAANAQGIEDLNTEVGDKASATITATTVWGAIEELETEAAAAGADNADKIKEVKDALDAFKATKGQNGGLASLDENGFVPSSQLPSYVDDVLEYDNLSGFPTSGEAGKIYVAKDTNLTYRWSGSQYTEISASIALGETTGTAYEGSKGKALADALAAHKADIDNPHSVTKAQVGLGNVENIAPADMPVSTATQAELDLKATKTELETAKNEFNTAVGTLEDADAAIKARLDVIEGTGAGSIKKALADANAYTDSALTWGEEA